MANMSLKNVNKIYPNGVQAVYDFNLEIKDGEFVAFVGPSGCGKSTTLRMIAGLEEISSGSLILDEKEINNLAPKERDIAMVFQSYALYPHMTVYHNMAFSLLLKKEDSDVIHEKVMNASKILSLDEYLTRKPKELSGGQRQRVALGRAIVRNPKVFLMDEPLSNLDAKLRVQMRTELIKLHKAMNATTIYVTHDQIEAMTMADRIVVMSMGYIQQIGSPKDVYDFPNNKFVAGFIGTPPMNFINGKIENGYFCVKADKFKIEANQYADLQKRGYEGKEITLGIRPENIHLDGDVFNAVKASKTKVEIEVFELLGKEIIIYAQIGDSKILINTESKHQIKMGDHIEVALNMDKIHFFDMETEERIR
ncbi:ABC transporter ATP-binding protein [Fusibacter sp. 3D3]|uniref:ABC transporter ATP-binding protein n=1 Tax=Fusibacter sp. 3D3 TaxID=1048380 RepID=UPI000853E002|nr:sn-glycerol-3-phosphate ABC transporter ATP-binding protein UgpC [Fusibacter sp. 3D3]GAU75743.1 multiple sugar ABC transporter [Fusibacter sp. 3D3]